MDVGYYASAGGVVALGALLLGAAAKLPFVKKRMILRAICLGMGVSFLFVGAYAVYAGLTGQIPTPLD